MRNPELRKLIKLFAEKEPDLNMVDIERIVDSPFEFQAHVMKNYCNRDELDFPSVRIPGFGIFFCPDYTKKKISKINERNKQKEVDNDSR